MGTVFTFDVRDPGEWTPVLDEAVAWLHHVDATFSTYRPDSVISLLDGGDLDVDGLHARYNGQVARQVLEVLDLCAAAGQRSGGYFTTHPGGRLDPSAVVKGWAIERASDLLCAAGAGNHAVGGGGDIQMRGYAAPGVAWRVGIADPHRPGALLDVVCGSGDFAVATSGTAERGAHIVDPHRGAAAEHWAGVTLVGESLTRVDTDATAAFAMGTRALAWVEAQPGVEAYAVAGDGGCYATPGFSRYRVDRESPAG